jgi:2-haloacid dehalogenase
VPARAVIFDLGGVLIDWDPRHLYRKLMSDEAAMEDFLARVCNQAWNEQQDAGRPVAQAIAALSAEHPECAELIGAFYGRFDEMMRGAHDDTVGLLQELDDRGVPLYALSNFSAETFVHARRRFAFLDRFRDIVLSGHERLLKPDPRFYRLLLDRHRLAAADAVFVDDSPRNVEAAAGLGMTAFHFRGAPALRRDLVAAGLLD